MTDAAYIEQKLSAMKARMRLPLIVAPMFLVSTPLMVTEACRAGIMGAFPAPNARTVNDLKNWLETIKTTLTAAEQAGEKPAPWAMNMVTHSSYSRMDDELALIAEYQPDMIITALGGPQKVVAPVHDYGGLVFADVNSPKYARKAVDAGADGLILICSGAGGHTGSYSHFAFIEEVRSFFDGPVILSGAIANARAIRAVEILGADFAYMGSTFIATPESMVVDDYRDMVVRCKMEGLTQSKAITGALGNWMNESLEKAGLSPEDMTQAARIDFSGTIADQKSWKNIWSAGQAIGQVTKVQPVREIIQQLISDYEAVLTAEKQMLDIRQNRIKAF
ncbi:NAD(P)H-dependent flavin oxidoreductase [Kordiimonas pumila]|uniref:NAD(P)H-dependent flavin oxidoreductase n=1 Tax=Kordiimonas pumila TaxID=2161677 RepID=A0ABV7D0Y9_9PROT|nr:nitronate monooxygenase [Kordiimonas pumila]